VVAGDAGAGDGGAGDVAGGDAVEGAAEAEGGPDRFLAAAIAEATAGWGEGGIPIGSVLVHGGEIIGRGHNRRVQRGSPTLHGEMDALENAGRLPASVYRERLAELATAMINRDH
jgi:cytosine deaminase